MSDFNVLQHQVRWSLLNDDGVLYRMDGITLGMQREWLDGQLSQKVTVHLANADTPGGQAEELCALGERWMLEVSDNGGDWRTVQNGVIWGTNPDDTTDEFTLTCYDDAIWLDSQDHWVFPAGMSGADVIRAICTKVFALQLDPKPTVGTISGPTATMPAIAHDGAAKDVIVSVLQHASYLGDKLYNFSVDLGVASCVVPNPGPPIYDFVGPTFLRGQDAQTLKGVATQVLVLGNQKASTSTRRTPLRSSKATSARAKRAQSVQQVQGGASSTPVQTSTVTQADAQVGGTIQVLEKGSRYQDQASADAAASAKLEETQQQQRTRHVTVAYVTDVAKGAVVHLQGRTYDDYYVVIGTSHDEDALTMELNIADRGTPLWVARRIQNPSLLSGGTGIVGAQGSTATGLVGQLLAYARSFKGNSHYVWGGKSPPGMDCSGFTAWVFNHFGIAIGAGTSGQLADNPSTSSPRAGDLVLWSYGAGPENQHVGIVTESGTGTINCTQSRLGNGVIECPINALGQPIAFREPVGLYR